MRHLVAVLALSLSLARPALAEDAPAPKDAAAQKDASGQTSDTNAPEGGQVKGYGYGTPSGTESNATAGQPTPKSNPAQAGRKRKAPQQEADHDSAQPNARAAEQGQHQGPLSTAPSAGKKHAKKKAKKAAKPAANAPPPGEPTR